MQSSPFRSDGSSRSSRAMHGHQLRSDHPTSSSRVVVAEGSAFVLQTVPIRASVSTHRPSSSTDRHVSAPHLASSLSQQPRSSQSRSVSNSITPPRSRQSDRPYRPPPSSSARFYERQQQLWMLQQPSLLPHTPEKESTPDPPHLKTTTAPTASQSYQPLAASRPAYAQPTSPPYTSTTHADQHTYTSRFRSGSDASTASRLRATSVSSLAPPEKATRPRSGSDAGSFTRSCISNGYQSSFDDDQPSRSRLSSNHDSAEWQAQDSCTSGRQDFSFASSSKAAQQAEFDDALGESGDADWDAELGISDADHAEPLRLPSLLQSHSGVHRSPTVISSPAVSSPIPVSSKLASNAVDVSSQPLPHVESIKAADLKGIRVTSSVSESWDGDYLFQNDEDPADAETHHSNSSQARGSSKGHNATGRSTSKLLHSQANGDADSDDCDVENWDDAFAWNADSIMTPSASTLSSLNELMLRTNLQNNDLRDSPTRGGRTLSKELPLDISRRLDVEGGKNKAASGHRFSTGSSVSIATDFSARLAAQSDVESYPARSSQDSDDFSASRLSHPRPHNTLGLARNARKDRRDTDSRSDGSGDDTETESPVKTVAPLPARTARRSLGVALGFDSRRRSAPKDASASLQSPSRGGSKSKDDASPAGSKSHARTQSKSKLGALQRLSFSRSRLNVANASSTSVNQTPETEESPQRPFARSANPSQASLLSQASTSSSRSRRGSSPLNLEKSSIALRATSFRRLLGRGDKSNTASRDGNAAEKSQQITSSRRGSEPSNSMPMLPIASPPRNGSTAQASNLSKSPPSFSWTGFRRSIEVTPTRQRDRSGRRDSDSFQRESPNQVLFAQPGSTSVVSAVPRLASSQQSNAPTSYVQGKVDRSGPTLEDGLIPAAGLRRDFSSSNTLRAGPGNATADASTPTRSGCSKASTEASTQRWQAAEAGGPASVHSDRVSMDAPPTFYAYSAESMQRVPGHHGSASRSVSASTAHSHTSAESMYGYRMRQQISVSSGPDALDSETSYGTSVGSSPGLTGQWSWASSGKRGANPSIDTKDTAWMASVDLSKRHEPSTQLESNLGRATSTPGSPLAAGNMLDSVPVLALSQGDHKHSANDTLSSPSQNTLYVQEATNTAEGPLIPSHGAPPSSFKPGSVRSTTSIADGSIAGVPTSSQATSSSATSSTRKSAPRRNSLSDLKIPSRISKAQTGIRTNISLVRDFAKGIEELKVLKASYMDQKMRSPLAKSEVEQRVQNWLECADVLIGLGEGRSESDATARVDTVSHTPLSTHIDGRRPMTVSDASSYGDPTSPLEDWTSRQPAVSGARSASGTSQATTSTTDGARSVDVHREIDILSALLGGQRLTPASQNDSRSHARFQSETYTRDEIPHRNAAYSSKSSVDVSTLTTPDRETLDDKQSEDVGRKKSCDRFSNTAPALSGANANLDDTAEFAEVDVGDVNRSAKRRLRSASRAGLQGLRDLLRVFKGDNSPEVTKASGTTEVNVTADDTKEQSGHLIDRPSTPSAAKQKRRSINLKRRSFLRSRTSLDSISAKAAEGPSAPEVAPPLPLSPEAGRYAQTPATQVDRRKPGPSPPRSSLDITWEAGSPDRSRGGREAQRPVSATTRAVRRISLQSALSGSSHRRRSTEVSGPDLIPQKHSTDVRSARYDRPPLSSQQQQPSSQRRPSLAVRPAAESANMKTPDPRRASTSIDTLDRQHGLQQSQRISPAVRSKSTIEATPPVVEKLALRPEAMPGLLVYVQATKQHLQAAIDELGAPR